MLKTCTIHFSLMTLFFAAFIPLSLSSSTECSVSGKIAGVHYQSKNQNPEILDIESVQNLYRYIFRNAGENWKQFIHSPTKKADHLEASYLSYQLSYLLTNYKEFSPQIIHRLLNAFNQTAKLFQIENLEYAWIRKDKTSTQMNDLLLVLTGPNKEIRSPGLRISWNSYNLTIQVFYDLPGINRKFKKAKDGNDIIFRSFLENSYSPVSHLQYMNMGISNSSGINLNQTTQSIGISLNHGPKHLQHFKIVDSTGNLNQTKLKKDTEIHLDLSDRNEAFDEFIFNFYLVWGTNVSLDTTNNRLVPPEGLRPL